MELPRDRSRVVYQILAMMPAELPGELYCYKGLHLDTSDV